MKKTEVEEKNIEMMKKILEQKSNKPNDKQHFIPDKSIGTGQKGKSKLKSGGSNNKI